MVEQSQWVDVNDKLKPELQQFGVTGGNTPSSDPTPDTPPPSES